MLVGWFFGCVLLWVLVVFFGLFFFDSFVGVGFMSFVMFVQFIKSLFLFYLVFFGANKFSLLRNAQKNVYQHFLSFYLKVF